MHSSDYISFRTQTITVEELLDRMDSNHIFCYDILNHHVTRKASFHYSPFIESVIIGLPLLPLVFDGSRNPWRIIDGAKRLYAIWNFANNKIALENISYSRLPENLYFKEMSPFLRSRFLKSHIPCYIINPGTPQSIIDDIQERICTTL